MSGFSDVIGNDLESNARQFATHLGNGKYLDNLGKILSASAANGANYEIPGAAFLDPKTINDALSTFGSSLLSRSLAKQLSTFQALRDLGFNEDWLQALAVARDIAQIASSVCAYVGAAMSVLKAFGIMKDGPSAFEALIEKRLSALQTSNYSIEAVLKAQPVTESSSKITAMVTALATFRQELVNATPEALRYLKLDSNVQVSLSAATEAVYTLLDPATWMAQYQRDQHAVWPWEMRTAASPNGCPVYGDNQLRFDHTGMIPKVLWAVHTYLIAIKALRPDYRSFGLYVESLREMAKRLEELARRMRSENMAWTQFTQSNFKEWTPRIPGQVFAAKTRPVGALDLCEYTDSFLDVGGFMRGTAPEHKATVHMSWPYVSVIGHPFNTPGPSAEHDAHGNPLEWTNDIANAEILAADANQISQSALGLLLFTSGYLNLVQLCGIVRHLATEPDRSETLLIHNNIQAYRTGTEYVTAQGKKIEFHGEITAPATVVRQRCEATVQIKLQEPTETGRSKYKILFRTLPLGLAYSDYYSASYVPDTRTANDGSILPHRIQISVSTRNSLATSPVMPQRYSSDAAWSDSKEAHLMAATFDIFESETRLFGSQSYMRAHMHEIASRIDLDKAVSNDESESTKFPLVKPVVSWGRTADFFQPGTEKSIARHPQEQPITLHWEARAEKDDVTIKIRSEPPHENFLAFLVIEETLTQKVDPMNPGELLPATVLQTAIPLPFTGAVTFVPDSFFKEEAVASAVAGAIRTQLAHALKEKFTVEPRLPEGPMARLLDSLDRTSPEHFAMSLKLAHELVPSELKRIVRDTKRDRGNP